MVRDNPDDPRYIEVKDSKSVCQFGNQHMAIPGPTSGIRRKTFFDLQGEVVKQRRLDATEVKTFAGISTKFEILCKPNGEVSWRRFPCFCDMCVHMRWDECQNVKLVGKLEIIRAAG